MTSLTRIAKKKFADDQVGQKAFVENVFVNISTSLEPLKAVAKTDLVIEAIVENLGIKQSLFKVLLILISVSRCCRSSHSYFRF